MFFLVFFFLFLPLFSLTLDDLAGAEGEDEGVAAVFCFSSFGFFFESD